MGDGFRLAALLGADSRVGAGRIDEGDDRETEFFGDFHHPQGFPVAFGVGLAEVPFDSFPGGAAFLMADEGGGPALVKTESGDDGRVVGEAAVAVDFDKILNQVADVIQGIRPLGMAGDLDNVSRCQPRRYSRPFFLDLDAEVCNFFFFFRVLGNIQLFDLLFKLQDILLEGIEIFFFAHLIP